MAGVADSTWTTGLEIVVWPFSSGSCTADQKNASVADLWDGSVLKIYFRRGVTPRVMQMCGL